MNKTQAILKFFEKEYTLSPSGFIGELINECEGMTAEEVRKLGVIISSEIPSYAVLTSGGFWKWNKI